MKTDVAIPPAAGLAGRTSLFRQLAAPLRELLEPPSGQNPALDVLRTFAILMVVAGHSVKPTHAEGMPDNLFTRFPLVRGGWTGVDLFFVLSGYLIGRQLWRELQKRGTIDVRRFMIRRGLRIWPLYYAALAFTLLVIDPGRYGFGDWWTDATFLANYIGPQVVHGGWSLCIEEQFYLLAPVLLVITASRIGSVAGYRRLLMALFVLLPVIRGLVWWRLTREYPNPDKAARVEAFYYPFHTHSDGLVIGLFLSNLEATRALVRGRGLLGTFWVVVAGFALCGVCYWVDAGLFNYTGLGLAFGSLVCFALPRTDSLPAIVRARPFYILSRLSYGMYLNHQWMTAPLFRSLRSSIPALENYSLVFNTCFFVLLALSSAVAACVTFSVIEWPFLRLRDRILHGAVVAPQTEPQPAAAQ